MDTSVTFPLKALDMSQFVLGNLPETRRSGHGNNLYDLAAIIVHHGSGSVDVASGLKYILVQTCIAQAEFCYKSMSVKPSFYNLYGMPAIIVH